MRRERLLELLAAAFLVGIAAAAVWPFRTAALAVRGAAATGWDAASHALLGLDLHDDLAGVRPGAFLAAVFEEHWWPPLFGLVSMPFHALFGRSLETASLPSAAAFVLSPGAAWLLSRHLGGGGLAAALLALVLSALLFLRSPMLVEMSTWPMFESLGGLLVLLAWLFFAKRSEPRALKGAALLAALLFFLKYHYGFFVLATFAVVLLLEETAESRREARRAAVDLLVRPPPFAAAGVIAILFLGRVLAESRTPDPPAWLPSRGNLCYGAFLLLLVWSALERGRTRALWSSLAPPLRLFARWGLAAPAVWLLIPGNVRAWYRQTIQYHPDPERNPLRQIEAAFGFLRDEYTSNVPDALPLVLVLVGLAAALIPERGRERTLAAAAWFALWPALLMCLSTWRIEARFLGVLVPTLLAVSIGGLLRLLARLRKAAQPVVALLVVAGAVVHAAKGEAAFQQALSARAPYRFSNTPGEAAFVEAMRTVLPQAERVAVALPEEPRIAPSLRLALRLDRRNLAPDDLLVVHESPAKMIERLRKRGAGRAAIAVESSGAALVRQAAGLTVLSEEPGPLLPGAGPRTMTVLRADVGP